MSGGVVALVVVFAIMVVAYLWFSRAVAPEYVGNTPNGTPVYVAPEVPVAGIIAPAAAVAAPAIVAAPATPTYTFHQGYGTIAGNLKVDPSSAGKVEKLKEMCNALAGCVGFTTAGAFKNDVGRANWVERNKSDPAFGLYVRN